MYIHNVFTYVSYALTIHVKIVQNWDVLLLSQPILLILMPWQTLVWRPYDEMFNKYIYVYLKPVFI